MDCRDVEEVLELEGLAPLPETARAHIAGCQHCQAYVSDLVAIVSSAHELPVEVEPPARVWVSLRTQLELEGIIKEPAAVPLAEGQPWRRGFRELFRSRALATVTVGALIAVAAFVQLRHRTEYGTVAPRIPAGIEGTVKLLNEQEIDVRNMHFATGNSQVNASLEQNLQQIDDFIAECEHRLKEVPQDELAREYLYSAYQQKAELLAAMMDRGRSVN